MTTPLTPVGELSYEQALSELEALVAGLESDGHTLDDAMSQFERGQELTQHCAALLEKADLKVQQLLGDDLIDLEISA
ncbi:MAG: exodeoxyribonuclease VII small subunit [Chloroflexota bacterium]